MRSLLLALLIAAPAPALAQVAPHDPYAGRPPSPADVAAWHRARDDARRAGADARAEFARRQELEARLTALELQAARQDDAQARRDEIRRDAGRVDAPAPGDRQALEARVTVRELQAARQPAVAAPRGQPPLRYSGARTPSGYGEAGPRLSPETRRALDESAARQDGIRDRISEIDAWLEAPR